MKKLFLSLIFVSAVVLGAIVIAQTITGSFLVNTNSCFESDGGLNYGTYGTVNGSFWWPAGNGTNGTFVGTFTDTCVNSRLLLEGVCGASISPNYSSLAGGVYVDCSRPNSAFGCVNGACVYVGGNGTTNSTNSTQRADLIVSRVIYTYVTNGTVTYNGTNFTNYRVLVNATVRNIGNATAGVSSTRIMLSAMGWPNTISTQSFSTPSINAGQSTEVLGMLNGITGRNLLQADADSSNVILESNEANNVMVVNATLP